VEELHLARRDVYGKFGKLEGNEMSVDAHCGDELLAVVLGGGDFRCEPVTSPVGDVGEEADILSREVL
jgi:hypothetical protein